MTANLLKLAAMLTFLGHSTLAGQPVPTVLEPIKHANAVLTVVDANNNEISYTPAELEKFTTYSITTTTPWRDEPAEFEGVMLADILAAHGLDTLPSILVTAENDYSTTIDSDLLETVDILVVTRVDGQAHSRRNRGPIQFIIDADAYAKSQHASESDFVWMAARIEAGQ